MASISVGLSEVMTQESTIAGPYTGSGTNTVVLYTNNSTTERVLIRPLLVKINSPSGGEQATITKVTVQYFDNVAVAYANGANAVTAGTAQSSSFISQITYSGTLTSSLGGRAMESEVASGSLPNIWVGPKERVTIDVTISTFTGGAKTVTTFYYLTRIISGVI